MKSLCFASIPSRALDFNPSLLGCARVVRDVTRRRPGGWSRLLLTDAACNLHISVGVQASQSEAGAPPLHTLITCTQLPRPLCRREGGGWGRWGRWGGVKGGRERERKEGEGAGKKTEADLCPAVAPLFLSFFLFSSLSCCCCCSTVPVRNARETKAQARRDVVVVVVVVFVLHQRGNS